MDLQKHNMTWKIMEEQVQLQFDYVKIWQEYLKIIWQEYLKIFSSEVPYITKNEIIGIGCGLDCWKVLAHRTWENMQSKINGATKMWQVIPKLCLNAIYLLLVLLMIYFNKIMRQSH
jgi:hypothetical protein